MIFYRAMINAPQAMFYVDTTGLRPWKKSIVIRGVYRGNRRGGVRGHGRGWGRKSANTNQDETAEKYLPDDSSSSESEQHTGTLYVLSNNLSKKHNLHYILLKFSIASLCLQINLTA